MAMLAELLRLANADALADLREVVPGAAIR
jgi:hypothetical protein